MPEAFSCHAFEYITKPFSPQSIFQVVTDIMEVLPPLQKYIEVISDRKTVRIFLFEIVSVITDAHYLDITLTGWETLRCRMTMPKCLAVYVSVCAVQTFPAQFAYAFDAFLPYVYV